jgi:hypothetical protein
MILFFSLHHSPDHDKLETRSISRAIFFRIINKPCSLAAGDQLYPSRSICNVSFGQNNISIQALKSKPLRCVAYSSNGALMLRLCLSEQHPERLNMS